MGAQPCVTVALRDSSCSWYPTNADAAAVSASSPLHTDTHEEPSNDAVCLIQAEPVCFQLALSDDIF